MTMFSQQRVPHRAAREEIPEGVRRALLTWFNDHDVDDRDVWKQLRIRIGYGEPGDVVADVLERFGEPAAALVAQAIRDEIVVRRASPKNDPNRYAIPILTTVPSPLFIDALEIAVEIATKLYRTYTNEMGVDCIEFYNHAAVAEINQLFAVRGINYRFSQDGTAEWHGDEQAYQEIVMPALAAVADPRLVGAGQEFGDALSALRLGTREGNKNAIRDASNAVESAMKSVLDEHKVTRTGNESADALWDLLNSAHLVAEKTKDVICAAPRFRNKYGGHGPNPQPDPVPPGVAEYTVREAASTIVYLAQLLSH